MASIWGPGVELATPLQALLNSNAGAANIGFLPTGIGAQPTTLQEALDKLNQVGTGKFFADEGGKVNRIADRLFVGEAVSHDGKANPTQRTWLNGVSNGIYNYLEDNATFVANATNHGVGIFSAARTSTNDGSALSAAIGLAGFAYNDHIGGIGGAWGMYSTVIRSNGGVNGSTMGLEIDVANMGNTVYLYPALPFQPGLTVGLSLAAGGETTNVSNVGISSAAMTIVSNDAALYPPVAKWEKGIVFHSNAIVGTDGWNGTGCAIALAKGHTIEWFNNNSNLISYIYSAVIDPVNGQGIIFDDFGTKIVNVNDGKPMLSIAQITNSANYLRLIGGTVGTPVVLQAEGTDANIDFEIAPKGTGVIRVPYGSEACFNAINFTAERMLGFKDGNNQLWYIPVSTSKW